MILIQLAVELQSPDWTTILVQSIITLGLIFGGAGFWEWQKAKLAAKREDKKEEKNYDEKLDTLSEQVTEVSTTVLSVSGKVDVLSEDLQELKNDLILLQEASEETARYRELRDKKDKEALEVQSAIIESIKGLMRDRLLDNYRRCMKKGYYTMEEREIYGKMFECYENAPFRGNGVMHDLRPLIKALPIEPPNENYEDSGD